MCQLLLHVTWFHTSRELCDGTHWFARWLAIAWYPVLSCLISFEISGGCTLLILCGLMPSYLIVRRQGLLQYSGHLKSVMCLSTFQNKGDGNRHDVGNLQNPRFCSLQSYGVSFQALPLAIAIFQQIAAGRMLSRVVRVPSPGLSFWKFRTLLYGMLANC